MRKNKNAVKALLWPVYGGIYYVFIRITGLSAGCPFYALTGFLCPGCGATRMFLRLGEGNLKAAFLSNQALFLLMPCLIADYIRSLYRYLRGMPPVKKEKEELLYLALYLLVFGVVRNLTV